MFSLPHIRRSAHTFFHIFGNHRPPSSNLQDPMTSREARQERRHTAIAHHAHTCRPRWCALNRDIHSQFSFQTALPGVGTRLCTIVPRGRRDLTRLAQHSTHGRVGPGRQERRAGNSFLLSSVNVLSPRLVTTFPVTAAGRSQCRLLQSLLPRSVTKFVVCVRNSVWSSMFTWFHFSPRDFSQLSFSGRPPHTTTSLQFP